MADTDENRFEQLLKQLRRNDVTQRCEAALILGHVGDKRAIEPLTKALYDESGGVAILAGYSLALLGGESLRSVFQEAFNDERLEPKMGATLALAKIGDDTAFYLLLQFLSEGTERESELAASALSKLKDRRAIPALLQALNTNSYPKFNYVAALGSLQAEEAIESLKDYLENPTNYDFKYLAANALIEIGTATAVSYVATSLEGWDSKRLIWRDSIISSFVRLKNPEGVKTLEKYIADNLHSNDPTRVKLALTISKEWRRPV